MRMLAFASRTFKELMRYPVTLLLGAVMPAGLLLVMTIIQNNVPVVIFPLERLAPAMAVFSLSFLCLFTGMLIARDRTSAYLMRMFATPLQACDYILGYTLPMAPIALISGALSLLLAVVLGLPASVHLLSVLLTLIPTALLFVGFGILLGTLLSDKAIGGVGSILVQIAAIFGGTWFDLSIMKGSFRNFAYSMPFAHAVDMARAAAAGDYAGIFPHIWWVIGYAVIVFAAAAWLFRRRMSRGGA